MFKNFKTFGKAKQKLEHRNQKVMNEKRRMVTLTASLYFGMGDINMTNLEIQSTRKLFSLSSAHALINLNNNFTMYFLYFFKSIIYTISISSKSYINVLTQTYVTLLLISYIIYQRIFQVVNHLLLYTYSCQES